jgi:putative transposase
LAGWGKPAKQAIEMPGAFSSNFVHIVFSTKGRFASITDTDRMWAYLGGIVRAEIGIAVIIGGMSDHAHLLIALRPDIAISKAINILKSNSSKWMKRQNAEFAWQRGYAAFSVSRSNVAAVKKYIVEQERHHAKKDFEMEFLALLDAHGVEYDVRYVFD